MARQILEEIDPADPENQYREPSFQRGDLLIDPIAPEAPNPSLEPLTEDARRMQELNRLEKLKQSFSRQPSSAPEARSSVEEQFLDLKAKEPVAVPDSPTSSEASAPPSAKPPLSPEEQELEDAFATRNRANLIAGLTDAATGAISAWGRIPNDSKAGDNIRKMGETPLEKARAKQSLQESKRKKETEELAIKSKKDMLDPNSDRSKSFRRALDHLAPNLKSLYGDSWDKIAEADRESIMDPIRLKEVIEQRKETARVMSEGRKEALQVKREEKERLSDAQVKDIKSYTQAISAMDGIISEKPSFNTGPISGRAHTVASWVGLSDPKKAAFKSNVGDSLAQYIHGISGSAANEAEVRRLKANLPSMEDNDAAFIAKAKATKKRLEELHDIELDLIKKQGKNTESFERKKQVEASPEDKKALEWANKNSQDPRAAMIKERLKAKGL